MATKPDDMTKPQGVAGALTAMTPSSLALTGSNDNSGTPQATVAPQTPGKAPETNAFLPTPAATPATTPTLPPRPTPTPLPAPPATTEERLNGLLANDSDYIKMAEAAGLRTANARGLLNSSMAAGAARGAAIERALPIAQADAQNATENWRLQVSNQAQSDILAQGAGYDLARDAAQAKSAQDLAHVQGQIQSALQAQGNTEQIQRMGVDLSNQLQINSQQLTNDLAKIAASGDQDVRKLVEAANQERVTLQQSIAAQDRQAMAQAMVNIFQIESQLRASLLGNDKISASERAAYERTISAMGDPIRVYISQLFGPGAAPASGSTAPTSGVGGIGTGGTGGGLDPSGAMNGSLGGTGDYSGLINSATGSILSTPQQNPASNPADSVIDPSSLGGIDPALTAYLEEEKKRNAGGTTDPGTIPQ